MTLHISRVRIVNFRNFGDLDIDPFPSPAVIVGENGVGKSNFLYALRLVLDPDLPDSARELKAEDIHDGAIGPFGPGMPGGAQVVVEVEFSGFDDDEEAVAALSGALTRLDPPMRAALTYRFAPRSMLEMPGDAVSSGTDKDSDIEGQHVYGPSDYDFRVMKRDDPTTDASRTRRLVSLHVLPALRDAEKDLARWNRSPLRTLLEDLDLDPAKLAAVAADIDAAAGKLALEPEVDGLQVRLATRLHALVGTRLPVEPTVGVTSSRPDSLLRSLQLFIDAARTRSVADTSLGAANVLYLGMLIEALAVRRAASAFVTTMMGVEEPEAHLHVGIQRRLFRHLLATEPTMLLTTHSPHIAAVAPLKSLLLLRAMTNETVATTTLQVGLDANEVQDISRYLDVTRAELLFARVVLLVEGTAEVFLLPALAAATGFDLDEYGVVIVNVAGTDFSPYAKLLSKNGLDIPYAVLTDGDPLRTSESPELGFRRAAELLSDQQQRTQVYEAVQDLIKLEKDDPDAAIVLRRSLQRLCANDLIFVGDETLEIDLLALIGSEMISAYSELSSGHERRAANMARDILRLLPIGKVRLLHEQGEAADLVKSAGTEDADEVTGTHRVKRVLNRIEERGKGRVAQRVADHVGDLDLQQRVLGLLEALGVAVDADVKAGKKPIGIDLLCKASSAQACLQILDWASRQAREQPLFDAKK
ncbi:ATP-dependent endonuclease [Nocardia sp. NPDC056100]|uniref:ATP-dependent nuclease n=1 Tax=Nocardia sp. NPDC056100 TaxID=3345712 RepID=UPI0035DD8567